MSIYHTKNKSLNKINLIIFDLDGVIIDSFGVMKIAFLKACETIIGRSLQQHLNYFDAYLRHMGKGFLEIMKILNLPSEMFSIFSEVTQNLESEIKIYPGVWYMLNKLKCNGYTLALATGKDRFRTEKILINKDLYPLFSAVRCSSDVPNSKPAPDMINDILNTLNVSKTTSLMVGDSESDIISAKNAGIYSALAVWNTHAYSGQDVIPDLVVQKPALLLKMLRYE